MENNQHSSNQNVAGKEAASSFANSQPGQQLPPENSGAAMDKSSSTDKEEHSERSLPEKDNETLGTP